MSSWKGIVNSLLQEPQRNITIDDESVWLDDENFKELKLAHSILEPHARAFQILLDMSEHSTKETYLRKLLPATSVLLKEAERNVNILQYASFGKRWRSVYTYTASLLSIGIIIWFLEENAGRINPVDQVVGTNGANLSWDIQDAIYHLDFALIKTNGWPIQREIHEFLSYIDGLLPTADSLCNTQRLETIGVSLQLPNLRSDGPVVPTPSLNQWLSIYESQSPVKLEGILDHWPVFANLDQLDNGAVKIRDAERKRKASRWSSVAYLFSKTIQGRRVVPVEIGKTYADPELKQKIMTFREYIKTYVLRAPSDESGQAIGYLAQHNLLTQIPSFRDDISVPEYINFTLFVDREGLEDAMEDDSEIKPTINAWLGPAGTVTPLHTDNYHNIFCQVVGSKYVRLYPPSATPAMYPMGKDDQGVDMSNTSSVPTEWVESGDKAGKSLEGEEKQKWEAFDKEKYVEFIVQEGEAIFFPRGWWHYVKSLEASFSVNFWWEP